MSDYLTRLVERTLGLSPTVRPDVPPTFAREPVELAPYDAPDESPSPDPARATRPSRDPSQRLGPALHPEPLEDTPLSRDEDAWPDTGERGYEGPPSTAAGPARMPPVGGAGSFPTGSTEKRAEIEHHPAGPERDDDQPPPRGPERHRQRPDPTPPDAAVPDETTEPEGSSDLPDLHETPTSRPPSRLDESPTRPSVPGARPAERSDTDRSSTDHPGTGHDERGTERGETDVAVPAGRRGEKLSSVSSRAAPPTDAAAPGRGARPGRPRPTVPDHPVSRLVGHEGRGQAIGREQRERTPEPAVDARGRSLAEPAASDRGELPSEQSASEASLLPTADRPRAAPAAGRVAAPHKREVARETPSPTVRITIGRVEVRAVAPEPAQPPPAARPESGLSLEDYLGQHDGGRR